MAEETLDRPSRQLIPHDDASIVYSAEVDATLSDECYRSAAAHASTVISLHCATTNADFNETRTYSLAKEEGRVFEQGRLFRLGDLHKDRIYDVSLACSGSAQVSIIALQVDLDARILAPGVLPLPPQPAGGGADFAPHMQDTSPTSVSGRGPFTSRTSTALSRETTTSSPDNASPAPTSTIVAAAVVGATIIIMLVLGLALYMRLRRRQNARTRCSDQHTGPNGSHVHPYALFPDDGGQSSRPGKKNRLGFLKAERRGSSFIEYEAMPVPTRPRIAGDCDTIRSGSDTVVGESPRHSVVSGIESDQ